MKLAHLYQKTWGKVILSIILLFVITFGGLVAYRLISGRSLGLRSAVGAFLNFPERLLKNRSITNTSQGNYTNIIFLHHSVGHNLIEQGGVRQLFTQNGYSFWDHGYNNQGLRDPQGTYLNYHYTVPNDNTDFDGMRDIFTQKVYNQPVNTFSALLQHEVIIIKSCFPNSGITSDEMLAQDKEIFLTIRSVMDAYPDKLFIIITQPPLNPAETDLSSAARARELVNWLTSPEFLANHSNIAVFDFFSLLAEPNPQATDFNMLRSDYRDGTDSHPNQLANQTIAPLFVDFVTNAIEQYKSSKP